MIGWLVAGAAVGLLAGCGAGHAAAVVAGSSAPATTSTHRIQGRVGQLLVEDGYVPEPASPDVAAAYLTIVNDGGTAARLTAVSSDVAGMVVPMTETTSGGVGSMAPLQSVVVPAHGAFRFHPGAAHIMLEQLHPVPTAGDTVSLVLGFTPGGTVTVSLPVTPIGATTNMPSMGTATP